MTKQLVVFGTAVMTTLLALVVLWQFHIVIVYVLISLALAATVRPFVISWTRLGIAARVALIFLFIISSSAFSAGHLETAALVGGQFVPTDLNCTIANS